MSAKKKRPGSYWAKRREAALRDELMNLKTSYAAMVDGNARLRRALSNIQAYAKRMNEWTGKVEVKIGGVELGTYFAAQRDYCHNAIHGPATSVRYTTGLDVVSAAARWGIDFDQPPRGY